MKYFSILTALLLFFSCSKTSVVTDADSGVDNDNSIVEQDNIETDDEFVDSFPDDNSVPDGDSLLDDEFTSDGDSFLDSDFIPDSDSLFNDDFELPDSDRAFLSCFNHQICTEILPKDKNRYCYYNHCWEVGDIAWEITLYNFEINPAYFAEKFPGVELSTIGYRIDIEYQSSGDYPSYTGTENFIKADKLPGVVLPMFTATPFSYAIHFFEQNPQTQVSYELPWSVSTKVTHGEIGNGDFTVQLEMYEGPIKVKAQGRFVAYIY